MSISALTGDSMARTWPQRVPFYYGWINVLVSSLMMTATLPARTHGLGLITEPLLRDLLIGHTTLAQINFAASILGGLFFLPVGWAVDRFGTRVSALLVTLGLGASVLGMAFVREPIALCLMLTLVRGFGQSAASVVSIALIGKWFRRRLGIAMAAYCILLALGLIGSIFGLGVAVSTFGWRQGWAQMGVAILVSAVIAWLFARDTPESCGLIADAAPQPQTADTPRTRDYTFGEVLRTPIFWVLSLGTAAYTYVWSATTIFNESILHDQGFSARTAVETLAYLTGFGLVANLVFGAVTTRERLARFQAIGLGVLAVALALFPAIHTIGQIRIYSVGLGFAGGIVLVVYFSAWGHLFGRAHLGKIQSATQLLNVVASAFGPVVTAELRRSSGSYASSFYAMAAVAAVLALAALFVRPPQR